MNQTRVAASGPRKVAAPWSRAVDWLGLQCRKLIDQDRWNEATTWAQRLRSVSWPRVAIAFGLLSVAIAAVVALTSPRGVRAYPPPLPTRAVLEERDAGLGRFKTTPPPGLVEANRAAPEEKRP